MIKILFLGANPADTARLRRGNVQAAVEMLDEAIRLQEAVGDKPSEAGTRLQPGARALPQPG